MNPPSVSITGGSSQIDLSIRSTRSGWGINEQCSASSCGRLDCNSGIGRSEAASPRRSRGFARPESTFWISRSRSRTPESRFLSVESFARSLTKASTESRRVLTSALRASGREIQLRIVRAPIGVLVTSRTPSSEASFATSPPGSS